MAASQRLARSPISSDATHLESSESPGLMSTVCSTPSDWKPVAATMAWSLIAMAESMVPKSPLIFKKDKLHRPKIKLGYAVF